MKKVELLTGANNPWEKPLYLCLWADSGCLGYRVPIHWLGHENQGFDLVGVGNDGTLVLCEIKAVLSSEQEGEAVADQVTAHKSDVREYLNSGLWREEQTAGVIGKDPMRFMDYKNYGETFKRHDWGDLFEYARNNVPDPRSAPGLSGRVCIQIVASKVEDSAALVVMQKMRSFMDSLAVEWPKRAEFMLAEVEVVSPTGEPGPGARGRQGRQWIIR